LGVLVVASHSTTSTPTTPTGWTVLESGTTDLGFACFYQVPSSTGALSPSSTVTSAAWAIAIAAYPVAQVGKPIRTMQAIMRAAQR
jgi:hypothetical protein